jgi:transitional endoplasmic reticulum ATPase
VQETIDQIKKVLFVPIERREELGRLGTGAFRGFLLAGPVGSGKSLLASCVLSYMKNTFGFSAYWVHAGNLLGTDAEDSLKKLFQVAKESQPSVICIDDIDILCSKESSKRPQGSPSVSLAIQMDRVKEASIYLLATTSMPEKLDVALKKLNRFDKSLSINTSSDESRCKILTTLLTNIKHNLTPQQLLEFAKGTSGFMAADLVMLLKEAGLHALQSGTSSPILLTPEDISHSLTLVQPMLKKEGFTDIPTTTLEDVGGLATLKLEL